MSTRTPWLDSGRRSITFRITLVFAMITTAVLLGLGLLIGHAVEQHFVEQDMDQLQGKTHLAAHLLAQASTPAELAALNRQLDESLVGHHGLALAVADAKGTVLFSTPDAPFPPRMLKPVGVLKQPQRWEQGGLPWRGLSTAVATASSEQPVVQVAVAVDISHHAHFMAAFRLQLWLYVAVAAALVGLLGWLAVRRGLAPLQAMRQGAAGVTASRLDTRLDLQAVPVELVDLATTLNDMLARLQDSFARLQDFASDLAHELRTPISNLMTETQVALTQARSPDEYRDILASNIEEFERLTRMLGDMLFLAKADNGLMVPNREAVDLGEQVRELFDYFEALSEDKGLRLSLHGSAEVEGDKLMLRRALANLLANAIRHTPSGGDIKVSVLTAADGGAAVSIFNTGEPIAPEHLPRLFDRFYRADPSRHRNGEGAGLGLAITKSIVNAHGGHVGVRSDTEGTVFEVRIP
jgi:two-component system heavy metal sensor histidine kinase CusS